jgi:hypothetical protein
VQKEDSSFGRFEAADSARCGICDIPKGGVVIVGVGEVDKRHSMDDSTRDGGLDMNLCYS